MRAGLLAVALVLVPAVRASAEWQVKPVFGATFGGGTTLFDAEHAVGEVKRTFGVSGMLIGEVVGVEGDIGRTPGFFQSRTPSVAVLAPPSVHWDGSSVTTITGNVVIALPRRLTEYTLRPYVVGGAGVMRVRTKNQTVRTLEISSNLPALDIGGGVVGFLSDRVGLSWDVRYVHSIRGKATPSSQSVGTQSEELSFWRVNMAFVVRLRHTTR